MGGSRNNTSSSGSQEVDIGQQTTIQDLAQAYMGDQSRWEEIAALNNLRAPYIHPAGLPGTLRPGDKILIPLPAVRGAARLKTIVGTTPNTPNIERLYGVDWALSPAGNSGQYDLSLSPTGDTDVALVRGIDNLKQAVGVRLRTSRGDSALYRDLGTDIILGTGVKGVDRELAKLKLAKAVEADPRITGTTGLTLNESASADIVDVEFNATVYGLTEKITIATDLPR